MFNNRNINSWFRVSSAELFSRLKFLFLQLKFLHYKSSGGFFWFESRATFW